MSAKSPPSNADQPIARYYHKYENATCYEFALGIATDRNDTKEEVRAYRVRFQTMNERMRDLIKQGVKKDDLKTLDQARARLKLADLGWDNSVSTTAWFPNIGRYYDEIAAAQ